MLALGLHLQHGIWSLFQTLGANHPDVNGVRRGLAWLLSIVIPVGFAAVPSGSCSACSDERATRLMNLNSRVPAGPLEEKWDRHKFELKLVNPANKRKYTRHRGRLGPGGRVGRGDAGRAGLQGEVLLFPGLAPPGPQHRRPGRDQRRQELPERRRQRLPALLRHRQGRRLPLPRGQRLPPGPGQRQHHRPVRGAGRALRAGVRRAPGQPLLRRRAGLADLLRPGPDRAAAPARRLSARSSGRSRAGTVTMHRADRDARPDRHRRPGPRHRRPATWSRGEVRLAPGRRGGPRHRRLRQRLLPLDQRQGLQRHRDLAGLQAGRRRSPIPASPRFTRPAFR